MKFLVALPLSAAFAFGIAGSAQAWILPGDGAGEPVEMLQPIEPSDMVVHPHDHCHGRSSGTAHQTCGSTTGGPSGGLF